MEAFGKPGIAPTWASSNKDLVSTALGSSRLWLTVSHGILNEVYWPATGMPQIRDLGFIVAREGAWHEVKRVANYRLTTPAPEVPLVQVVHTGEDYELDVEFLPDPDRDVVLIRYRLKGTGYKLYPLLAPHLERTGHDNTAWTAPEGLYAQRGEAALCLKASSPFLRASAGYAGMSDGWQDFHRNGAMTWTFDRAQEGNVALMGELPGGEGVLALAFSLTPTGAHTLAASSLAEGYAVIRERFIEGWERCSHRLDVEAPEPELAREGRISFMVLKAHHDRNFPGAMVASLSIPWGQYRDDPGGYHLVWARDMSESALALLSAGQAEDARQMLAYLIATQRPDGSWYQNFYPDGTPYWQGVQLDETALPVLLACKLAERDELGSLKAEATRMVRRALGFIAQNGPVSPQDRWEENPGYSPFTLACLVAALAGAAELGFLDEPDRSYARSLADNWNARIEEWTYVTGTDLDREYGIQGHYVRIVPPGQTAEQGCVVVRNRMAEEIPAGDLVGLEFLHLVRFGLRAPDDPRIRDTVRLIDALLKVETPSGSFYHRYNGDGYGEQADGGPFDGTGIGRLWPLLTGERGHYALLAGEDPLPYLRAMAAATSVGGMIPEQVWDADPIPEKELFPGRPTGSAMPLVWAHAEYLKLLLALKDRVPSERLAPVAARYLEEAVTPAMWHWRPETPLQHLAPGSSLLIEAARPFTLHFGFDGWQDVQEREARSLGLGRYGVRFDAGDLDGHATLEFTRRFGETWEGQDYALALHAEVAQREG